MLKIKISYIASEALAKAFGLYGCTTLKDSATFYVDPGAIPELVDLCAEKGWVYDLESLRIAHPEQIKAQCLANASEDQSGLWK